MRHSSRLRALAILLALAPAAAFAQRGQQWAFRDGEWATLAFEVPETSDQSFYLGCDKEKRRLSMSIRAPLKGAKPGTPITIEFSAGGAKASILGKTETDELYPFVFSGAEGFAPGPLLDLLAGPSEVVAKARTASLALPAKDRASLVARFRASCPVK